jgi:hypothetical protein
VEVVNVKLDSITEASVSKLGHVGRVLGQKVNVGVAGVCAIFELGRRLYQCISLKFAAVAFFILRQLLKCLSSIGV